MLQERVVAEADLAREAELGALGLRALELDGPAGSIHMLAELAVGHGLEADLLLAFHKLRDAPIFDGGELISGDLAGGKGCTGTFEALGAQEASHDIKGIGRLLDGHAHLLLDGGHPSAAVP